MTRAQNSRKTRREVLAEFRGGEILAAARRVFARRGFDAATLEEVAQEAGIAKGTLYLYFPSKEEIFWAAVRERMLELRQRAQAAMRQAEGIQARLRAAIAARGELMRSDTEFMRIYLTEFGHLCAHPPRHRKPFRELYLAMARDLADVLEDGMRTGELRPGPPLELALTLQFLMRDCFTARYMGVFADDGLNLENFVFELFWYGVRPQSAPPRPAEKPAAPPRRKRKTR